MSARKAALLTLSAIEQNDAWANGELKKEIAKARLDRRDAALATRLCFGTLQNRSLLDYYLSAFSSVKLTKMEPRVRNNLRLALYQILYMERIPHSAAVNEAVALTRKYAKNPRAAGMVNGILRALLRSMDELPSLNRSDAMDELSLRYSHPRWLLEDLGRRLSMEDLEALLKIHNSPTPTTVQVNRCHMTTEAVRDLLEEDGVTVEEHPWLHDCLLLEGSGNLEQLRAFQQGAFYVQDPAARLAVLAAAPQPGDRVLDACAAPGGKSFAAAIAMQDTGEIVSCDQYPHKQLLLEAGAQRLGFSCIKAQVCDARMSQSDWEGYFDLVIADVPCSGLGVIRKKPEIRFKDPALMRTLPKLQSEILQNLSHYVRVGGTLLYATCTLRLEENEDIITAFLERNAPFTLEAFSLPGPLGQIEDGMVTLWPQQLGTDGFFMARLRRQQ